MPKQKVKQYTKQVNVRLTEAEYDRLEKRALEKGLTVSGFARLLLKRR